MGAVSGRLLGTEISYCSVNSRPKDSAQVTWSITSFR
jgi:hypothetical protein